MTWILTNQGSEYHLQGAATALNTAPTIHEIANSLAQINRFNGHASRPYSVAEHSLLVADLAQQEGVPPIVQLAALMHDAHESITGDISSPVKWTVGLAWEVFEHRIAAEFHNAFGLRSAMHSHRASIKRWDLIAMATERRDLMPFDEAIHQPWPILDNPQHPVLPSPAHFLMTESHDRMRWHEWADAFIKKFRELSCAVEASRP
jgi:uncharacterized protein